MDITLEQAKVFEAVARLGTIQKAAAELHRGHSAVLYSLKCLEDQTRITLFDRSGHRNRITLEGEIVLKYCRRLLETRKELEDTCFKIKEGWEPSLKLIYDEVVDFNFIGSALFQLNEMQPNTEVKILSAHLDEVEAQFEAEHADMMVTVLPFQKLKIPSKPLSPIHMYLVAHRAHGLVKKSVSPLKEADLNRHTFVAIKTDVESVGLSTDTMKFDSKFYVNSFTNKKLAIMNRLGFGWLPDYLIKDDLAKGTLQILKAEVKTKTTLQPRLYHKPEEALGRASKSLLKFLGKG